MNSCWDMTRSKNPGILCLSRCSAQMDICTCVRLIDDCIKCICQFVLFCVLNNYARSNVWTLTVYSGPATSGHVGTTGCTAVCWLFYYTLTQIARVCTALMSLQTWFSKRHRVLPVEVASWLNVSQHGLVSTLNYDDNHLPGIGTFGELVSV